MTTKQKTTKGERVNQMTVADETKQLVAKMEPQFKAALPAHIPVQKFIRVTQTAIQTNPDLGKADRMSLFAACTKAAQDGLLPDGREGAIVTYRQKDGPPVAQWMPMVAGLMKKVRNSGEISTWSIQVVKENDFFDYQLGDHERIDHKPAIATRGKTIGAYSIVTLKDGEKSREFMNIEEINAIRGRSRAKSGPWETDYDEMCKKTVARRHSKRLPMSTDLDEFIKQDDVLTNLDPEPTTAGPAPAAAKAKRSSRLSSIIDAKDVTPPSNEPELEVETVTDEGEVPL